MNRSDDSTNQGETRGFPLAALFLLTALCAVLTALLMQVARAVAARETTFEDALTASGISAAISCVIGGLIGLAQRGPLVGLLVGFPVGFMIGALVGPVCLLKLERVAAVLGISLGGAVLLIVVALVTRFVSLGSSATAE